jgi:hypothetical protein
MQIEKLLEKTIWKTLQGIFEKGYEKRTEATACGATYYHVLLL